MFCAVHGPTVSKCFANELGQYSITNDITCLSKSELYTLHMPMKVAVPSIVLVKLRLASRAHSVVQVPTDVRMDKFGKYSDFSGKLL